MRRVTRLVAVSSVATFWLVVLTAQLPAQQAPSPLQAAQAALGARDVRSLRFSGFGATYSVGQSPSPKEMWPRVTLKRYEADVDFVAPAMRVLLAREAAAIQPRGGGAPFAGEQRVMQYVAGGFAWDQPIPVPRPPNPVAPPPPPGAAPPAPPPPPPPPAAQPQAVAERLQQIWATPHGFLKAAVANSATTRAVSLGTEVSFMADGRRYVGILTKQNLVDRVQTWVDSPVLGDMLVETFYRDYEKQGTVMFPRHITQNQGGFPALDVWIASVEANQPLEVAVPDVVRAFRPPPVRVESETIAPGVHYLRGGSHHSVAIEMRDHIVLVEAPQNEARSLALIAALERLVASKPIRVVVNTHHHFDHSGGLRTIVNQSATVVTHEGNRPFYEAAWASPRTLGPDALSKSGKAAVFQTFADKHVLTDGSRTIEVHRLVSNPHNDGFAVVYLPAEKILIEADAYTPAAATPAPARGAAPTAGAPPTMGPPPAPVSPATVNLYDNIRRLKLDVAQIAALHGPRLATMDDLAKAVGR